VPVVLLLIIRKNPHDHQYFARQRAKVFAPETLETAKNKAIAALLDKFRRCRHHFVRWSQQIGLVISDFATFVAL
jgi:hypothetical protein